MISNEPFGVAFRKGNSDLREKVQQTLDRLVKDGSLARISRKWFAEDLTNPKRF